MDEITPEDREEYEQQLDQLTEKELLLQILVELQTIRYYTQPRGESETEEHTKYRCKSCNDIVRQENRQAHLVDEHGAPRGMDVEGEFTEV